MVRDVNREPLADFYALVHCSCIRSEVSPLCQLGTLVSIWEKLHESSWCTKMHIVLRGSRDHALKADRSLIDPIMKLKAYCPQSPGLFACKPIWSADRYKPYESSSVYPFDADRVVAWYFAGVKHLTRLVTRHLFFETYHFYCWTGESLRSVLLSQASPTHREID
jgi:hypothetical protein